MTANIIASSPLSETALNLQQKDMCKENKQKELKKNKALSAACVSLLLDKWGIIKCVSE